MRYFLFGFILFISCKSDGSLMSDNKSSSSQTILSLAGRELLPLEESQATINKKDSLLFLAKMAYEQNPNDLDNIIWLGRRTAYLYRYNDAINIFTQGIKVHPESPELYRHRGHRYISTRDFYKAILDFRKAASFAKGRGIEIEPDGIPNKLNIPLSNLQFNIYYHWGLAHYLRGEFSNAAVLYEKCMEYSINPDLLTATADWLYMAYKRDGNHAMADSILAQIDPDFEIIENESYFKRLLMYKGLMDPNDLLDLDNVDEESQLDIVTQGYGVGNYYLYNGDEDKAKEVFNKILECDYWPAFGYIAAEAEIEGGLLK